MTYAKVIDKKVTSEGPCPVNLKNVSNFYKADDTFKISHGYYPVKTVGKPQQAWQNKTGQTYKILKDRVEKTIIYSDITLDEYKSKRIEDLDNYLKPKYPDLYTQVNAAMSKIYKDNKIYNGTKADKIKEKVVLWRDYFYLWKGNIEACNTYEEIKNIDYRTEEDKVLDEDI